jgi:hypothetical protein
MLLRVVVVVAVVYIYYPKVDRDLEAAAGAVAASFARGLRRLLRD